MSKPVLALYDSDRAYVNRFLSYCKAKKNFNFNVIGFSDPEKLKKYLNSQTPSLLLSSEENPDFFRVRQYSSVNGHLPEPDVGQNSEIISKYQSAEKILLKVRCLLPAPGLSSDGSGRKSFEILGFYSPGGGCGLLSQALKKASEYSLKVPVLYVNPERFSGLSERITAADEGMSELIMYRLRGKEVFEKNFAKCISRMDSFDVLLSPSNMEDMDEFNEIEWREIFEDLCGIGGYEVMILDFSEAFREIDWIFDMCKKVYVPANKDFFGTARRRELADYLRKRGREDLLEKVAEMKSEISPEM